MKIQEYSRDTAHQSLNKWRTKNETPNLSPDYSIIRTDLLQLYNIAKNEAASSDKKEYVTDVLYGLSVYKYFNDLSWFNLRTAANDGFWRYLAVAVIPEVVAERWGVNKDNYFWKQSNRLWPKTIWWYVYLTWNESSDATREMLLSKNLNSDTIQGIVERTGKKGTFVEVYREIIHQYSNLEYSTIIKFKKQLAQGSDSLFRAIMKLNTARSLVTDPCLCKDGVTGYVSSLFDDLTQNL